MSSVNVIDAVWQSVYAKQTKKIEPGYVITDQFLSMKHKSRSTTLTTLQSTTGLVGDYLFYLLLA